jgi:hypothetical protein
MKFSSLCALLIVFYGAVASPVQAQDVKLKQTEFEDGTGSIGLPAGWTINGVYKGAVQCAGPNGATVTLKMPWAIMLPGALPGLDPGPSTPIAPPGDIVAGLRDVLRKKGGATLKTVRATRTTDLPTGVPAYYLLYEFTRNGKAMTGMGYFVPLTYGPGQPTWQLYSSTVIAPTPEFPKMVRTMLTIWRSWRPNGQPPREGSSSAIFDRILKEKQDHYDQIQKDFHDFVLGDPR